MFQPRALSALLLLASALVLVSGGGDDQLGSQDVDDAVDQQERLGADMAAFTKQHLPLTYSTMDRVWPRKTPEVQSFLEATLRPRYLTKPLVYPPKVPGGPALLASAAAADSSGVGSSALSQQEATVSDACLTAMFQAFSPANITSPSTVVSKSCLAVVDSPVCLYGCMQMMGLWQDRRADPVTVIYKSKRPTPNHHDQSV